MIPTFDQRGLLPSGLYEAADWNEFAQRFGFTPRRQHLLAQMQVFVRNELAMVGAGLELCVGGSFVTDKQAPGDIDCTIVIPLHDLASRGPLCALAVQGGKRRIRDQYEIEFYPTLVDTNGRDFRAYFEYVGPKTALEKGLGECELRGIVKVTQWHLG